MGLTLSDSGGGDFHVVPEGTHIARCVRVIDLGMQPGSQQYPEPRQKVLLAWEIPDEPVKIDGVEQPAIIQARFTASLHKKSQLRSLLESWRGRAFTEDELKGWSLKSILDVPCMLTVVHSTNGDKTWANVKTASKLPKGFVPPARVTAPTWYEIEHGQNDVYHSLSEKLRATIDVGAGRAQPQQAHASAPTAPPRVSAAPQRAPVEDYTDDALVPF